MDSYHEWLLKFRYPDQVSLQILKDLIPGKTILDVGCGPDLSLGKEITKQGGKYTAFDLNPKHILLHTDHGVWKSYSGNVVNLKKIFKKNEFDYTHTRSVIMHLSTKDQTKAIQALNSVGRKNVIIDLDWTTFTDQGNPLIKKFIEHSILLASLTGSDLFHGTRLKQTIIKALGSSTVEINIFNEGEGYFYQELIFLGKFTSSLLKQLGKSHEAEEVRNIVQLFKEDMKGPKRLPPFSRPNLVSAIF